MDDIPISMLFSILIFLILVSGFFSGSETGLMSLNRYRLRHLVDKENKGAERAFRLLKKPDRLIGLILLGNNFVNILASAIATVIGIRLFGETGILIATIVLTIVVLIFAEVTPKTLAAMHPEKFALPATLVLEPLLRLLYPLVWFVNLSSKIIFKIFGIRQASNSDKLSSEELRIVVNEAASMIPQGHQEMLLSILDLEKVTVDDIMVPRNEVIGIDLEDSWHDIKKQFTETQHTRLPVYEGDINHMVGIIHIRRAVRFFHNEDLNKEDLNTIIREAYYVPSGTPLNTQLLNFQHERRRNAMVVNEYGDILGLVTLEDILEEIVGEFTTDPSASRKDLHIKEDGTYLIDGSITVRELNKILDWQLPTEGPKTLNGLIIEYLEHIPEPGTSMLLENYPIEIVQTTRNAVKTVLIDPNWNNSPEQANKA
ncbi:MAG: HlyC/CorC family transporter [Gammaproteobacteria bacterium]|nr:HlyC/CorC family transporter [Gammaproteobacteria bacterium]MCW8987833.1 HlyC/CorC family transporter [Gammaproteobacteria bacterium]MCW9030666.1 HlyC/CorC family transporter [Gammaproteobacteria bacterium]